MMSKGARIIIGFLCFMGFVVIRFRESQLFYDPLISFFKGYYLQSDLPEMDTIKLFLNLGIRYGIHMILSLIILWVTFLEKGIIKFATVLYVAVFIVLLVVFIYSFYSYEIGEAGSMFYVRRFLIQPLLIFILLPAFFYYRKVNS